MRNPLSSFRTPRARSLLLMAVALSTLALTAAAQQPSALPEGRRVEQAWSVDLRAMRHHDVLSLHQLGDLLLVVDQGRGVSALRLADGSLAWFLQLPAPLLGTPTLDAGLITFGAEDHVLVVDARSGHRVFHKHLDGPLAVAPRCDGAQLYLPMLADPYLVVLDLDTGLITWDVLLPTPFVAAPLWMDDRVLVVATEDGLRGFVTDAMGRGRQAWYRKDGRAIGGLVPDGGRVLVATSGLELLSIEAGSGLTAWKNLPGARLTTRPLVAGNLVAVGTTAGLVVVDRRTGATLWNQLDEQPVAGLGSMLLVRRHNGPLATRDWTSGVLLEAGNLPEWQALDGRWVVDVRGGSELRVWKTSR